MSESTGLPIIVIPMGDPNGIGPEIAAKALADASLYSLCRPLVVGDAWIMARTISDCHPSLYLHTVESPETGLYQPGFINLIDLAHADLADLVPGTVQALAGQYAFDYIEKSVRLALSGQADALATTPINKESLRAAQVPYIGHTEILAGLAAVEDPLTLFETNGLRVFFLTRHVSLRQACDLVTRERVRNGIRRCLDALGRLGVAGGTLAVAGLNPHSGEHGLFGDEEMTAVAPAVADCQAEGLPVVGPVSADSVFHQARIGRYAAVLSLYHDQGHIATKTLDFERTISLTLGLPFLRTSVDHGTALDIAGKGIASPVSMVEAIRLAAQYAPHYRR
ncbi:MAG TPA: 4-hydroxythreonine-4-phosphate dehydrogenase PdxA [Clostridiales bacterium]|nr:4-hydroxythreonine-4-phosphate dehydrogenase PdxA [Clostridiales bacterium]